MSYKLIINKKQAEIICKALDLFSRIGRGQFEEILKHPTIEKDVMSGKVHNRYIPIVRETLDVVKGMLTGHAPGGSTSITMADEPNRVAYDIFQVVQQQLAVDNNDLGHSVRRYKLNQWSEQPLPAIRVAPVAKDEEE